MNANTPRIITKQQAKASGRKTYFTGEPCHHGHICERFVKRSWCVKCAHHGIKPSGAFKSIMFAQGTSGDTSDKR